MHRAILSLAALPLLAGALVAEETTPPPPPPPPAANGMPGMGDPARMAEQFNKMKERNPDFFKRLDTDGDGTISTAEAAAFIQKEQQQRQEREDKAFADADQDKDGKLDRAEFAEALKLMHRPMMRPGKPGKERADAPPPKAGEPPPPPPQH